MLDYYLDHLKKLQTLPAHSWLWLLIVVPFALFILLVILIIDMVEYHRLKREKATSLELVPPAFRDKSPLATGELFSALHHFKYEYSLMSRLLRRKVTISLEIVSTKTGGIRYIARVPDTVVAQFRQNFAAYLSSVQLRVADDYMPAAAKNLERHTSYRLSRHFAYPLKLHDQLSQHDPVSYITNAMTKLEQGELMALQIVVLPIRSRVARRIYNQLLVGKEPKLSSSLWKLPFKFVFFLIKLAISIARVILEGIGDMLRTSYPVPVKPNYYQGQPVITPRTTAAQDLYQSLQDKLGHPLFQVAIRGYALASTTSDVKRRTSNMSSALANFDVPGYQGIRPHKRMFRKITLGLRHMQFARRLPTLLRSNSCVLSSEELASLYHFPNSLSAQAENIVKSLSKTLPASIGQKTLGNLDIIIGENHYNGSVTPIGLTEDERQHHMYIIGGTGNGKTTLLLHAIMQDIHSGKGVAVIDPHGDLATTILGHIPKSRVKDVVYINPEDISYPVGINLLELPKGCSDVQLLHEKDLVTERVISVLRKVFSDDDTGGHRIEYVLRNAIHTAYTVDGANLFTIFRLLTDERFRKTTVNNLEDGDLKNFWRNELGKAGEFQRVKMSAGVTAKIGRFLFSAPAKRMLEQEHSTIDFDEILQSGKILICNFSKGLLGEDTSALFGTTILAKLQLAALRRARVEQSVRTPYYLYVDEFQNFATMPFVQMLSEARKYKLFLVMAEQSTSQQEQQRLVDIILANVGTVVAFRSGSPADERYILPLFQPYLEKGEIASLPAYCYYVRIAAKEVHEPMSAKTIVIEKSDDISRRNEVVEYSRKTYAKKYESQQLVKPKVHTATSTSKKTVRPVLQSNKRLIN
jgi:TraM recognition site of TraD and TraG/Helicase HerA, central domain